MRHRQGKHSVYAELWTKYYPGLQIATQSWLATLAEALPSVWRWFFSAWNKTADAEVWNRQQQCDNQKPRSAFEGDRLPGTQAAFDPLGTWVVRVCTGRGRRSSPPGPSHPTATPWSASARPSQNRPPTQTFGRGLFQKRPGEFSTAHVRATPAYVIEWMSRSCPCRISV